jgi:hypothetical protein
MTITIIVKNERDMFRLFNFIKVVLYQHFHTGIAFLSYENTS